MATTAQQHKDILLWNTLTASRRKGMCHAFNSTTKVYVGYNIYRIALATYRALIDIAHPHRLHYACHDADEEVHLFIVRQKVTERGSVEAINQPY